jgi:hypothetical protein
MDDTPTTLLVAESDEDTREFLVDQITWSIRTRGALSAAR